VCCMVCCSEWSETTRKIMGQSVSKKVEARRRAYSCMAQRQAPMMLQDAVKDRMATQLAMQREIQMAVAIAQARSTACLDTVRWNVPATISCRREMG
jgi:hypothetical protein